MSKLSILCWGKTEGDPSVEHKEIFSRKFRRIGPFVKLAQVAAAKCLATCEGVDLKKTGLFIGTGLGNTADIIPLAQAILHPEKPHCSPMTFAGSLGNAASFFVAQSTGCLGPSVTMSQEELSFEAALQAAVISLIAGDIETALVGGVDVVTQSYEEHIERMNAKDVIGEVTQGAGFLMLSKESCGPRYLEEVWIGRSNLDSVLDKITDKATILPGWRVSELEGREHRINPSVSALRIVEQLDKGKPFYHIQRNRAEIWGMIHVS